MSLRFRNISHAFGAVPVLSDLSFEVKAGQITCLLGPSGGGKSTLLRLAAGLEPVQSGAIEIAGEIVASPEVQRPPEQRPVGMMFQENALFPHLTVAENVSFGLMKQPRAERSARVASLLEMVGCRELGGRLPHQLSGGQQQRVALVRSLAPEPQVLLMDEPYASVDISLRRALREAARRTLRENGTTTVMVTHDPSEAMEMADVIAVLDEGHIVQTGTPQQLYEAPATPSVAAFFGDAQRLSARPCSAGFETDFGVIQASEALAQSRNSSCEIVVRPRGLELEEAPEGSARIEDLRYVGDGWLAFIRSVLQNPAAPLRVFIPDPSAWSVGDRVSLRRAGHGFYVFEPRSRSPSARQEEG